jgi:hypothetical protein
LDLATAKLARKGIRQLLSVLEKQLAGLDAEIARLIESDDDWKAKAELLQSVPASDRAPVPHCWQNCPNWERSTDRRLPHSSE